MYQANPVFYPKYKDSIFFQTQSFVSNEPYILLDE